jgi:hypothetical protein
MTVWIKRGVFGDLAPVMQKALGRIIALYAAEQRIHFYITSIAEGNHGYGSLHYIGLAVDFLKQGISRQQITDLLGSDFDVCEYDSHFHVEYDPQ